jgi:hypothetical protein
MVILRQLAISKHIAHCNLEKGVSYMQEQIEHRVIKLELKVEDHAEELKKLQGISVDLRSSLSGIEKTLNQIKYLAIGAVLVILSQSVGVTNVLKLVVGM